MKIVLLVIALVLVLAGGFVFFTQTRKEDKGVQPSVSQPTPSTTAGTIVIKSFSFSPAVLTVKSGTKVTWVNEDPLLHDVVADTFRSENLEQGDRFEFTFNQAGTFDYICGLHPSMKGQVIVE